MGGHENPATLQANEGIGFQGPQIGSLGFLVSPDDESYAELSRLNDPRNGQDPLLKPYFGGEDINSQSILTAPRFVIDTDGLTSEQIHSLPSVRYRLLEMVRPDFIHKGVVTEADQVWWNFRRPAESLRLLWQANERVLCVARVSRTCAFTFLPRHAIANEKIVIFKFDDEASLCLMQSRIHEVWARLFSATMKDDLQYALTDCLETFPFPERHRTNADMRRAGKTYLRLRDEIMRTNDEGLTQTYNRFHGPHEKSPEIKRLRELHDAMDRAVLEAYGWHDLAQTARCEFLLDYEEEDGEEAGKKSKKKEPWRLRWPDDFRDEVLARLLELNKQRAEQERLAGLATDEVKAGRKKSAPADKPAQKRPRKAARVAASAVGDLFAPAIERSHRYGLLLLRAWDGKPLTRRAFNAGMILMLDDKLRIALLDNKTTAPRHGVSEGQLNQILTELKIDGFVEIETTGHQQIVKVSPTAPPTDDSSADELKRISEVKEYFRREAESGNVTESEESVDAELDLVPAA
jgi:hypothetical protein